MLQLSRVSRVCLGLVSLTLDKQEPRSSGFAVVCLWCLGFNPRARMY